NYQPVTAGNQTNPSAGFQDKFGAEKAREKIDQQYVGHDFDAKKHVSEVSVSLSSSAQSRKQDDKTKNEARGKSPVESFTRYRDLSAESKDCSDNSINELNANGTIVPTVGQNSPNSTNTFSATSPSNAAASPTYGNSSFIDASQLPNDLDIPELEDITYSNDEDDVDHLVSQIVSDLSSTTQTRSMTRVVRDQGGLSQMFNDDFHTLARIEDIRLFFAYASFMSFMVYQMDVKSACIYGTIKEEVYVYQPPGFEDPDHPDKDPRAWYEILANYLLENGFQKGKIDQTLFIKRQKGDILLVQIYVDDIIFGATNKDLCKSFEKLMKDKFQIDFNEGTHILFGSSEGKSASTPIDTEKPLLKDPDGEDVDVHTYRLISWQCKKQTVVATSSTEDEYVATASCCTQVLWIQNQLLDYGLTLQVFLSGMESLKRMSRVTNIISVGHLTTQQMVLNSPCLTHIRIG
nr:putative ribonuclease H-like domain-containing protein [Tanacetum cinerariifolium]